MPHFDLAARWWLAGCCGLLCAALACSDNTTGGFHGEPDGAAPDARASPDVRSLDASAADAAPADDADSGAPGPRADAAGSDSGSMSDELCGMRPSGSIFGRHVLRFESPTQDVLVQLVRRWESAGVGESQIYALDGFGVRLGDSALCSDEQTPLEYDNSHHGWIDVARATFDDARFELALTYSFSGSEPEWVFALSRGVGSSAPVVEADDLVLTGAPVWCSSCPAPLRLVISEVMVNNQHTLADEQGEYQPWIEIFNPSTSDIPLTGWSLSNDLSDRRLFTFAEGVVPRHEAIVIFADNQPEQGALHANFTLMPSEGAFVLTAPDGVTDGGRTYTAQPVGSSLVADYRTGDYVASTSPTPGVIEAD